MRWYNHLYVGEKAAKKRYQIIQSIRGHKPLIGAYVITPAINGNNILEVYWAWELEKSYYRDRDIRIVGIAADYQEALEVVMQIIDELYKNTGGFDLAGFLEVNTQ